MMWLSKIFKRAKFRDKATGVALSLNKMLFSTGLSAAIEGAGIAAIKDGAPYRTYSTGNRPRIGRRTTHGDRASAFDLVALKVDNNVLPQL